jgi:3-hydroxybutyrate dehydrogenase
LTYKSLDLNVSALIKASRLAIRDQVTRASPPPSKHITGVILNVSSLAAQFALFNQPIYCSSKAAVSAFTRALAPLHQEFGIKVVAVAPGNVATPLWTEDVKKALRDDDVLIHPDEVAERMLDVVESDEYPGGTVLEVTKGRTRRLAVDSPIASGAGATASNMGVIYDETIALLNKERHA